LNGVWSHLEYKCEVIIHLKITKIIQTISVYIRMNRAWINSPHISVEYEK